jgi:hypothetical protein
MHSNRKPLPLKQRTSSVDARRDYSTETWMSLIGVLKAREFVITVDHFSIWKRHLAWAMENGKDLREYVCQRYASSMVFMSLLLSTELSVLFNSAEVTTAVRQSLRDQRHDTISFWAGILVMCSAILTILGLLSSFTAWTMVSAVSDANAHCILRSSVGQYVAELPGRFIVGSIYTFILWLILFFFLLLPVGFYSLVLLIVCVALFVHTITAFSAFGRVIMHTGAMGSKPIFDASYESSLLPHSLHNNLLNKVRANLENNTSIMRQYRSKIRPIDRQFSLDELSGHLCDVSSLEHSNSDRSFNNNINDTPPPPPSEDPPRRQRTESLVKFADGFDTNGDRITSATTTTATPLRGNFPMRRAEITLQRTSTPLSGLSTTDSPLEWQHRPPPRPSRVDHAARRVSTTIKEDTDSGVAKKWLQASSSSLDEPDVDAEQLSSFGVLPLREVTRLSSARTSSMVSSLGSMRSADEMDDSHMTEDEKFDRDYGDLFDGPDEDDGGGHSPVDFARSLWTANQSGSTSPALVASNARSDDDEWDRDNNRIIPSFTSSYRNGDVTETEEKGDLEEQQRLLDRMEHGNSKYDSIPN